MREVFVPNKFINLFDPCLLILSLALIAVTTNALASSSELPCRDDLAALNRRMQRLGWSPKILERGTTYYPKFFLGFSSFNDEELTPVVTYRGLWRPLRMKNYNPLHRGFAIRGSGKYIWVATDPNTAAGYSRRIVLEFQIPSKWIPNPFGADRGFGVQETLWPDDRALINRVGFGRFSLVDYYLKYISDEPYLAGPPKKIRWRNAEDLINFPQ